MGWWRTFLDSLDSPGGHIATLVLIMSFGVILTRLAVMDGTTITIGSFTALIAILKDAKSNRDQQNGHP